MHMAFIHALTSTTKSEGSKWAQEATGLCSCQIKITNN